jgi:hypothetical protein
MMKVFLVVMMFFMCSNLILVQPAYALTNPKSKMRLLEKKLAECEKLKEKQKNQPSIPIIPIKFQPYSFP